MENPTTNPCLETEDLEIKLLLDAIFQQYGYDFHDYAAASLKRRIVQRMNLSGLLHITELIPKILYDKSFFEMLLQDFSINVTEMFRDPLFYLELRKNVIPFLRTYPFIRIWIAGCSTGEEVYSLAILLQEEGVLNRTQIYATDINEFVIKQAKDGIYSLNKIQQYTTNYIQSGGKNEFSDYYSAQYDSVIINRSLKKNITFAAHNLVTDEVFNEMHLILCRNVLIYFNQELKNRVLDIFNESLGVGGFLGLGRKETLGTYPSASQYTEISRDEKIYQKRAI